MIPVDPDAPEARQWLREELAKAPYQAARPTWFDRLSKDFLDWITSLTAPSGDSLTGWIPVILIVLVAAVLVAAYVIAGPPRLRRASRLPAEFFGVDDRRSAEDMRRAAAAAAAAGDWTLAGQEMFRALARGLIERSVLLVTPGTTAHAFAVRAAAAFPESAAGLAEAAESFDRLRYLGSTGTERDYLAMITLDDELRAARPHRLESAAPTPLDPDPDLDLDGRTMTVTAPGPAHGTPANAPSSTLTLRAAGRRWLFWIVAGASAVLVSIAAALIAGGSSAGGAPLAADNAAEAGGRALVEVLRGQGVTVTEAGTLAAARAAADGPDATVLFFDPEGYLDAGQLAAMADLAPRTVVVAPHFTALQTLAPEVRFGGVSRAASLRAGCDLPAAVKAGTISPRGPTLTVLSPEAAGQAELTGCFPSDDDTFSVVERRENGRILTLVADTALLSNGSVDTFGNAALALNLLGRGDTLVWYLPTLADVAQTGPPSLGELTPGWVTPTLVLLVLVALAAFIWRGRRFGPLVAENLPVTVRASETMEGRARLYARGDARLHAIDALRIGTIARLAARLGLPGTAGVDEVILFVAAVTSRAPAEVRSVLVGAVPASDRDLVALSDRLQDLERAAMSAATPQPPGRMDP